MAHRPFRQSLLGSIIIAAALAPAFADEGMWLFNNPPLKQLKEKYHFEPTPQWLEHLQKSSVRFNSGGSGSVVFGERPLLHHHHRRVRPPPKISTVKKK